MGDQIPYILTCDEVADILRVTVDSVWKLCRTGELKAFKVGSAYRVLKSDIEEFITRKSNQRESN